MGDMGLGRAFCGFFAVAYKALRGSEYSIVAHGLGLHNMLMIPMSDGF